MSKLNLWTGQVLTETPAPSLYVIRIVCQDGKWNNWADRVLNVRHGIAIEGLAESFN